MTPSARPSIVVLATPADVARSAAELVANRVRARPRARMLLPTGHTPLAMYAALRAHAAAGALPAGRATALQLDEYAGLSADDPHSYRSYLRREIGPLGFGTRHELSGDAPDPGAECARYQAILDEAPIDLAVLGLGRDGHVAFDEPGSLPEQGVRRVRLHAATRADAAGEFGGLVHVPEEALTVGLSTLHDTREILLLVTGAAKAEALRAALERAPSESCPASLLRSHPRLTVLCDREAAIRLPPAPSWGSSEAIVVLGHREADRSASGRTSNESLARLHRAATLAVRRPPRAVILTGYSSTGGLSEAEQMRAAWSVPDVPALLEVAGRNTAENATCSLPLILALGGIRHVTVVTSSWHLRTPFFFAPYRRYGLRVSYRGAHAQGWRAHLLAEEALGAVQMRAQRAAAYAAMAPPPEVAA